MSLKRFFFSALLLVLMTSAASAYTIVMRNGRRVEIPNNFIVTKSTLTYEVGSGVQITIQIAGVDIPATERANREAAGSFWQRANSLQPQANQLQTPRASERSITNQDLEVYRRRRIQSEIAYEKRRKELGLNSLQDQQRQSAEIAERTHQYLLNVRDGDQRAEEYWRGRASDLRTELASNQAQIDYVRRRIDELPTGNSFGSFSTVNPFGIFGAPIGNFPFQGLGAANVLAPSIVTSTQFGGNFGFRTGTRNFPGWNNQGRRFNRYGRNRFNSFPQGSLFALPYQTYDYSQERTELLSQLNELEMQHAGLKARWREFAEEARRAGVYPGWLR